MPEDVVEWHGVPVVAPERLVMVLATASDSEHALTFTNARWTPTPRHTTIADLWAQV